MTAELFAQAVNVPQESGYAVGWFTLALLNAGLAQSKRHSGLLWFFGSLLLGPLATFILVACYPETPPAVSGSDRTP